MKTKTKLTILPVRMILLPYTLLFIASMAMTGCEPSEESKEISTSEVIAEESAKTFTKAVYNRMVIDQAHGKGIETGGVYRLSGVVTSAETSQSEGSTSIILKIKPWDDSAVIASFVFAASQMDFVMAKKPGDRVHLKAKLNSIMSARVDFTGSVNEGEF